MGKAQRDKGKVGERELAVQLRKAGHIDARRGVQYHGGPDSPDVVGIEGVHIECKRTERISLYNALKQAGVDAGEGDVPIVAHRRSRSPWVVVVELHLLTALSIRWLKSLGYRVVHEAHQTADPSIAPLLHEEHCQLRQSMGRLPCECRALLPNRSQGSVTEDDQVRQELEKAGVTPVSGSRQ